MGYEFTILCPSPSIMWLNGETLCPGVYCNAKIFGILKEIHVQQQKKTLEGPELLIPQWNNCRTVRDTLDRVIQGNFKISKKKKKKKVNKKEQTVIKHQGETSLLLCDVRLPLALRERRHKSNGQVT